MKKDIYFKSFFDENAKIYGERYLRLDTPRDILFSRRKSILIRLIKELQIFPKSLADLGCGSGEITEAIMSLKNNHMEFNKILLVDSSKNMLEISNERIRNKFPKSNIYSINESIEENIFNNKGEYELVICTGLIAYISDLEKFCIYIRNISEKNTKVILQMSIKYHLLCLIYSIYMNLIRFLQKHKLRRRNFIFTNFYSLKELNKIMNSHGFILERKRKFGFDIPGFTSTKYLTKLVKFLLPLDHLLGTDICLVYKLKNKIK